MSTALVLLYRDNQTRPRLRMGFRQLDEGMPITDITLSLSQKVASSSEILGLQGIHEIEHVPVGGDEQQHQVPAI